MEERGFRDRRQAGQRLATALMAYAQRPDVLVLGLARGGVPVAFEVARALSVPLDVLIVRRLGAAGEPELALGAVASAGGRVLNDEGIQAFRVDQGTIEQAIRREQQVVAGRGQLLRGKSPAPDLHGRTVILVDDG